MDEQIDFDKEISNGTHVLGEQNERSFILPLKHTVEYPGDDEEDDVEPEGMKMDFNLNAPRSISSDLILQRINILIVKTSANIKDKIYPGIHPEFHLASPDPAKKTRGAVILALLNFSRYLVRNNVYWTYRELLYFTRGYLTSLAKYIPWAQMRPNVRLLENILQIQPHSLPFYGRPRGLIALGRDVFLKSGNTNFGKPSSLIQLPLGDNSVRDIDKFISNAMVIIYIESHAEINRLVEMHILDNEFGSKIIMITSSGNPDKGFRMVLSKLASDLDVPVKSLTDCDLGGFFILCTLAFGTFSNFRKDPTWLLTPDIQPIGIVPEDILETDRYCEPMTQNEKDNLNILKAKWTSHGIVLEEDHPFKRIISGFANIGKKMSLAQMVLNLDSSENDFSFSNIVKAVQEREQANQSDTENEDGNSTASTLDSD